MTLQDEGRLGWKAFGIPPSGAMDKAAARLANQLLDNAPAAPVLELVLQGAALKCLRATAVAITGADASCPAPMWRVHPVATGEEVAFPMNLHGVWTYLAVPGGFVAEQFFGSASAYPRGGLGRLLAAGDILSMPRVSAFNLPWGVAGRFIQERDRPDYAKEQFCVWRGPQWDLFSRIEQRRFVEGAWAVSSNSDRIGYRLEGSPLQHGIGEIHSEPVRPGSIQVPESGLPIVTMRDGPTVGGYPKIAVVQEDDLSLLAQRKPGQTVRFSVLD